MLTRILHMLPKIMHMRPWILHILTRVSHMLTRTLHMLTRITHMLTRMITTIASLLPAANHFSCQRYYHRQTMKKDKKHYTNFAHKHTVINTFYKNPINEIVHQFFSRQTTVNCQQSTVNSQQSEFGYLPIATKVLRWL